MLYPASFGVVCFEVVATRMKKPFQGMPPAQVMKAVAHKRKRPEVPDWASASPDVVTLMERCWKQDPAERPEGFGPVVRALEGVAKRVGDPRNHSEHTPASPGSVAASTAAEKESFREEMSGFSGLNDLIRQNSAMLEQIKQLIPGSEDSSVAHPKAGGDSLSNRASLRELNHLVKMARVLQEIAVRLAAV